MSATQFMTISLLIAPITNMTSKGVTTVILDQCTKLGLEMEKLVGQGYDSVSTMSGQFNSVQAKVKQLYPKAIYIYCVSHR